MTTILDRWQRAHCRPADAYSPSHKLIVDAPGGWPRSAGDRLRARAPLRPVLVVRSPRVHPANRISPGIAASIGSVRTASDNPTAERLGSRRASELVHRHGSPYAPPRLGRRPSSSSRAFPPTMVGPEHRCLSPIASRARFAKSRRTLVRLARTWPRGLIKHRIHIAQPATREEMRVDSSGIAASSSSFAIARNA